MDKKSDVKRCRLFVRKKRGLRVVDAYRDMLAELCAVRQPAFRGHPKEMRRAERTFIREHIAGRPMREYGVWAYFPWTETLVHMLPEEEYYELRTARNKNLITPKEQAAFRQCPVAVIGLSVGSHAAASLAMQGGSDDMRLADPDVISASNLNRIRASVDSVGMKKTDVVAREIYGMNPFACLRLVWAGVTRRNLRSFLTKPSPVGVIIEEIDDVMMKFAIRKEARALRVPVISATDNGDGILLDVERYDVNPKTRMFNGRAKGMTEKRWRRAAPQELVEIMAELIGASVVTHRMMTSAREVGSTVYSWPQLGGAAQLAGSALAYAARMIATGGPLPAGRTVISFESLVSRTQLL